MKFSTVFSKLAAKLGFKARPEVKLILLGIGYPSHRLIELSRRYRGVEVIAVIDDYPWNHRTLVQGVRVYYPSEIAALAARQQVRDLVIFTSAQGLLDTELTSALQTQSLRMHRLDDADDPQPLLQQLSTQ